MRMSTRTPANGIPRELDRKFGQARLHIRAMSATKGLALVLFTALAAFAIAVVLDRLFYLQTSFRLLVLAATLGALAVCVVVNLAQPLLRRYTARHIAMSVEDRHPQLGDLVVSTVELAEMRASGKLMTSAQLVDALADETLDRTRDVDFRSVAPFAAIRWALALAVVFAAIVGAYCLVETPVAQNVLARILYPTADIPPFTYTGLEVAPGSCTIAKGSDIEVVVTASGKIPPRATLAWRAGRDSWRRLSLSGDGDHVFRYTFKNVLRPITYRLRAGDARTQTFSIVPVEPPAIIDVSVTYHYPDYTGLGEQPAPSSRGNVRVLRGTRVEVTATATKPLESAWVVFGDGTRTDLGVRGASVGPLTFVVQAKDTYSFHLRDEHGFTNSEPVPYTIVPVPDREPEIDITEPKGSIERTPDMDVPIRFVARDDFGLATMRLVYHATPQAPKEEKDRTPEDEIEGELPIALPRPRMTDFSAEYVLELGALDLQPGMVLRYHLEATDTDTMDGPKSGRSVERIITIISDEDSFSAIEREQQALQRRLRKIIQQQETNKKLTEQLERELADAEQLSPADADRLEEARRAEEAIGESTRALARDFDPTIETMQENPLIQTRSVMRMQEMKSALDELARREMARASSQLRAAREAGQTGERSQRLESAGQTEQEILNALNKINDQFEQLRNEQRLLSLAAGAKGMARQQDRNIESAKEARRSLTGKSPQELNEDEKRRLRKLVDRQHKLRQKLEEFQEQAERTLKQLEYKRSEDAASVESLLEELRNSGLGNTMKQAEQELQASHLNKSLKPQKEASDTLWQMAKRLEQAQQAKLGTEFENTEEAMQAHISEIDRLIELEQGIIASTEKLPSPQDAADAADGTITGILDSYGTVEEAQRRLHERAGEFSSLLTDIFAQIIVVGVDPVTPMRAAVNSMRDAAERLRDLRRDGALDDERRALEHLLEAREQLAQALAQMMAEARIAQMQQQIDKLAEIIEKQRKINDDTKQTDAARPPAEELTAAFKRLIERLAGRQGRLGDEVADLGELVEQLRTIGEKMREVSGMLKELRTGKDVQDEQEKILTALEQMMFQLQAQLQSAMQAMGMSTVRGGGGGGNRDPRNLDPHLRELPGGAIAKLRLPERLRRELLQAWSEKYPESFRELLSLYYSRLSDEENPY
jgi:hypothetical protein